MENRQTELKAVRDADRRFFLAVLGITLALRLGIAAALPLTGDEAYYWDWGRHLAGGYYDQPPMVGWLFAIFESISHHRWVLRLPAVLLPAIVSACWVQLVLRFRKDSEAAWLTGSLLLLLPWTFLNVLVTTDTPLLAFASLSLFFFLRAMPENEGQRPALTRMALAGATAGAAFLSKYFVVLILPVFAGVLLLSWTKGTARPRFQREGLLPLSVLLATAAPAALWHLYWNYENCWINLVFNLVSRNGRDHLNFKTPLIFLGQQLYLLAPLAVLARTRLPGLESIPPAARRAGKVTLAIFGFGVAAFAWSSLKHGQGLHWTLTFHFALWLALGLLLPVASLRRLVPPLAVFTALHIAVVGTALALPVENFQSLRAYRHLVLLKHPDEFADALRARLPEGAILATNSYTLSSVLGWASEGLWDLPVFLNSSRFGRQSDLIHDWSIANGKDVAVFSLGPIRRRDIEPYFASVESTPVTVRSAKGFLTLGRAFQFNTYRDRFLGRIRDRFYRLPPEMPCGGCTFLSRYFPTDESRSTAPAGTSEP